MKNLTALFYPESIAVVGATENTLKWGSYILTNILDGGYRGKVHPVTVRGDTVYGRKAYRTLRDIEGAVDLVFITTPADTVMEVMRDCAAKHIANVVLITSGFSETGEKGEALEENVNAFAREHHIRVVGPNTMGIVNTASSLYATGSHVRPRKGGISIITQSGNVGNQIMEWAEQESIGIGKFVGSGNEGVLSCEDYLEYLADDEDTSVVLMYIEGVDNGRRFREIAEYTTRKKPVIALKAGRTAVGSKAAQSHTGAMAGSHKTYESVLKQSGVILAHTPTELLTISSAFDSMPLPKGKRVGVVTLGGGWGVITADECEERGLELPPLPRDVYERLDALLPPFWSRGNPVDLVGQPDIDLFFAATDAMVASDAFDAVILLGMAGSGKFVTRIFEARQRLGFAKEKEIDEFKKIFADRQSKFLDNIVDLMEKYRKPVYPVALISSPGDEIVHGKKGSAYSVILYSSPEEAVFCLDKQYEYSRYLRKRSVGYEEHCAGSDSKRPESAFRI